VYHLVTKYTSAIANVLKHSCRFSMIPTKH